MIAMRDGIRFRVWENFLLSFLFLFIFWALPAIAENAPQTPIEEAKRLFHRYIQLEAVFEPDIVDLYADEAVIKNIRIYPDGKKGAFLLTKDEYTDRLAVTMPAAAANMEDVNYSDVTYGMEGDKVRINATRHWQHKDYAAPFELLVGPRPRGGWGIYEEISYSKG